MKIRPWEPSFTMWADGRTDITKQIVAFQNFANALNKWMTKPEADPFFRFHNQTYFFYDICKVNHKSRNEIMANDTVP